MTHQKRVDDVSPKQRLASNVKSVSHRHRAAMLSAAGMRGFSIIARVLLIAQLARLLSVEDFAAWVLLQNLAAVACILSVLSLDQTLIRVLAGISSEHGLDRAAEHATVGLVLGGAASVVCAGVFTWGLSCFSVDLSFACTLLASSLLILNGLHQLVSGIFRGLHKVVQADALTGQFGGPVSMVVLMGVVWFLDGGASVHLFDVLVAANIIFVALLALTVPAGFWRLCVRPSTLNRQDFQAKATELGATTASLMASRLMAAGVNYGDVWVAGLVASDLDLGTYGAARALLVAIITPLAITSIASMASVAALYSTGDRSRLEHTLRTAATASSVGGLVVAGGLLMFSDGLADIVFGGPYSGVAALLPVMMIAKLAHAWGGMSQTALNMTQYERYNVWINAVCFAVVLIGGAIAATLCGLSGLVWVWAGCLTLQAIAGVACTRKLLGIWVCPYHHPRRVWNSLITILFRRGKA